MILFLFCFFVFYTKAYVVGIQVEAIQVCNNNIGIYKEVDTFFVNPHRQLSKVKGLIGVCVAIRSNIVFQHNIEAIRSSFL